MDKEVIHCDENRDWLNQPWLVITSCGIREDSASSGLSGLKYSRIKKEITCEECISKLMARIMVG
jgi:hypothetical protein